MPASIRLFIPLIFLCSPAFSNPVDVGFKYRGDMTYTDSKIADPENAESSNLITLHEARLALATTVNKTIEVDANYGLTSSALNWAWIKYSPNDSLSFLIGREFTNEGGWENFNWLYDTILLNPYVENHMPLGGAGDIAEVIGTFGNSQFSLQLVDDVVDEVDENGNSAGRHNKSSKQPAWILEYTGNYGNVSPLLQFGQYDLNHSRFVTLGLNLNFDAITAFVDVTFDSRSTEVGDESKISNHLAITADIFYQLQSLKLWAKFASYDVKQPDEDIKGNATPANGTTSFEDNAQVMGIGAFFTSVDKAFQPYVAFTHKSGKFFEANSTTDTEVRAETNLKLGVLGEI